MQPTDLERRIQEAAMGQALAGPPQGPQPSISIRVHDFASFGFGDLRMMPGALQNPGWVESDRVLLLHLLDAMGVPTLNLVRLNRTALTKLLGSAIEIADDVTLDALEEQIAERRKALADQEEKATGDDATIRAARESAPEEESETKLEVVGRTDG